SANATETGSTGASRNSRSSGAFGRNPGRRPAEPGTPSRGKRLEEEHPDRRIPRGGALRRAIRRGADRTLSGSAGAVDRRFSPGRQRGRGRALSRATTLSGLGAAGGDRQPQRGRGQYRNRARGA